MKTFKEIYDEIYQHPEDANIFKEEKYTQFRESVASKHGEMGFIVNKNDSTGLGHPLYNDLELGETFPGDLIVFFLDIRGFTKLSISIDNQELVRILQAVSAASIYCVLQYGGFVAEFTGDGIMAYFGGRNTNEEDAFNALKTTSLLMKGIKETVNERLNLYGDETVKVGMGLEFGNVLWTRIGLPDTNQVKPVSEVQFIAGKSSCQSGAWEAVIGSNIAEWVPDIYKDKYDTYSFQRNKKPYQYERFLFNWNKFYNDYNVESDVLKSSLMENKLPTLNTVVINNADNTTISSNDKSTSGHRPLKDQPFFGE